MDTTTPRPAVLSKIPLGHRIVFTLGESTFPGYCDQIVFDDNGEVLYTIVIYPNKGTDFHLRLTEIPGAFVEKQLPEDLSAKRLRDGAADRETIARMGDMCDESLPPELHNKWGEVVAMLRANRKALKSCL